MNSGLGNETGHSVGVGTDTSARIRYSTAYILDGPSGSGKTAWIRRRLSAHADRICLYLTDEEFCEQFLYPSVLSGERAEGPAWLTERAGKRADILAVDNMDLRFRGMEWTQREAAKRLAGLVYGGMTVIVAGIEMEGRVPAFLSIMRERCADKLICIYL